MYYTTHKLEAELARRAALEAADVAEEEMTAFEPDPDRIDEAAWLRPSALDLANLEVMDALDAYDDDAYNDEWIAECPE